MSKIPNISQDASKRQSEVKLINNHVSRYLSRCLTSKSSVNKFIANSYIHENGFIKHHINDAHERCINNLRLHIWDPDIWESKNPIQESLVHSHLWHLDSLVLTGELRFELYKESKLGESSHFKYRYIKGDDNYRLNPEGAVTLDIFSEFHLAPGSTYSLSSDTLHKVVSSRLFTITLMGKRNPSSNDAFIYSPKRLDTSGHSYKNLPYEYACAAIKMALEYLR